MGIEDSFWFVLKGAPSVCTCSNRHHTQRTIELTLQSNWQLTVFGFYSRLLSNSIAWLGKHNFCPGKSRMGRRRTFPSAQWSYDEVYMPNHAWHGCKSRHILPAAAWHIIFPCCLSFTCVPAAALNIIIQQVKLHFPFFPSSSIWCCLSAAAAVCGRLSNQDNFWREKHFTPFLAIFFAQSELHKIT